MTEFEKQVIDKLESVRGAVLSGGGSGSTNWGGIGGTMSNQPDLQSALDGKQPIDSDLTAIAALTTTSFGRGLLALAAASDLRSSAGLVLGTDIYSKAAIDAGFQPLDSDLTAIAALTTTSFGRSLLAAADASALRTLAGLVLGTDIYSKSAIDSGFQPLDSDLTAIAALTTTSFGRSLLAAADASALRTLAGLVLGTDIYSKATIDAGYPVVLKFAAVSVLTAGTPADIATINVPAALTRWLVLGTGTGTGAKYIAETAAGTLAAASVTAFTTTGGGGSTVLSSATLPTAATAFVTPSANSVTAAFTSSTIVFRQTANSANAGTISGYVVLLPLL